MKSKKTLLIVTHAFTPESYGGVEIYTRNIYNAFKQSEKIHPVVLTRTGKKEHDEGLIYADQQDPDLFYIYTPAMDISSLRAWRSYEDNFKEFLISLRPDIVHFQHFLHLSLDWFKMIRDVLPQTRILLTLHEYLLLCPNNGQMVKTFQSPLDKKNAHLCLNVLSSDCERCSPLWPEAKILARAEYTKDSLENIDLITTPSHFLRNIMVEKLGIQHEKIIYSENGQEIFHPPLREGLKNDTLTLGFIGQINPYKGLHVLLDAMAKIEGVYNIHLKVYGAVAADLVKSYFAHKIEPKLNALKQVKYCGPYVPQQLPEILSGLDMVVVPSVWWENSPLVIQESFLAGIPVLCSGIGGMAEKVTDGVNGLHFAVNDSDDLFQKILYVYRNKEKLEIFRKNIPKIKSISENRSELESIYFSLLS